MPYAKQNSPFAGLDELASLPGEAPLDKTMLWQKLEARQEPKKKRLHTAWYWAAAALVCMIAAYPLLTRNNQQSEQPIAKEQENKIIGPVVTEKKAPLVINNIPAIKEKATVISHQKQTASPGIIVKHNAPAPVQVVPEIVPGNSLVISPVPHSDTVPATVAVRTPKKLTVVHNNELEQEDKIAEENISKIRSVNAHRNKTPKEEYAGALNFRIHLKN